MSHQRVKRAHGGFGVINPPSDEETEIEISAISNSVSGKIEYSYIKSTLRHAKRSSSHGAPDISSSKFASKPSSKIKQSTTTERKTEKEEGCKQGASAMMSVFEQEIPALHAALLSQEYHSDLGKPCLCSSPDAKFRCRSCTQYSLQCQVCILRDHARSVWHHIEEWMVNHFKRTSLYQLGYRHRLGHLGNVCPHRSKASSVRNMTILHTNGFHHVSVEFCACHDRLSEPYQLVAANLFSSSFKQLETAFTFELLDTFQKISLHSKINVYDYHRTLQEMTNAAFPQDIPDRYHEICRVVRVWNHLAQVRRAGQCHNFDEVMVHRRPGSIGIRCPACPEIHVNVDRETVDAANENEAHKYTLFISADGNFKLQRKNKRGGPDDVALNKGRGYFVDDEPYQKYLKHVGECKDDCICQHLRAVKFCNIIRFKNAAVSGVIVIQCARHGFYLPQGLADLKRGEAFANTDYALAHALAEAHHQRWIMMGYDVFCSYWIKIIKRFLKYFPSMVPVIEKIRGAVPKLHIKNHIEDCQYRWNFSYLPFSGETCGEMIEGSHGEQNGAAASTKEQNAGHRHDSLDGIINYWNWTKNHEIGGTLYRFYVRCLDTLKTREKSFFELSARMDPIQLQKWNLIDDTPRGIGKNIVSVHHAKFKQSPPTQAKARQKLIQDEYVREIAGLGEMGEAYIIGAGIDLERDQDNIHILLAVKDKSESDIQKLVTARRSLRASLVKWREKQFAVFPLLREESNITSVDPNRPEDEPLLLPSYFNEAFQIRLGLVSAAKAEYELRIGCAHDRLQEIRTAIQTFNHSVSLKARNGFGQKHATRARTIVDEITGDARSQASKYRKIREALLKLGLPADDPVLQPLHDSQLWAKNTSLPARLGDLRKEDPWFWHVACPAGFTSAEKAEWSIEMDRVKWFRDRSLRNRAREEREILEEEFKRAVRSFSYTQSVWIMQGNKSIDPGARAYAFKQAAMNERLAFDCSALYGKALQKAKVYDKWFREYIEVSNT